MISAEQLQNSQLELSDEELEGVTGGWGTNACRTNARIEGKCM